MPWRKIDLYLIHNFHFTFSIIYTYSLDGFVMSNLTRL